MANINITDTFGLNGDLQIRDDSPLASAKLLQLVTTDKALFGEFNKPIDQAHFASVALGAHATSPALLNGDLLDMDFGAGINCTLSITKAIDGLLFKDDGFSPLIPIASNQAWVGVELDVNFSADASASAHGVGVELAGAASLTATTYSLISTHNGTLPLLRDACASGFSNFSLTTSAGAVRAQLPGTVNEVEVSGSIAATLSLEAPVNLNALASANLPFNQTISIQPAVTLKLAGSIRIAGDFIVRCFKESDSVVTLGVYKKRGTTVTASFTAGAGVGGNIGDHNVLDALLNAALPGVDVAAAAIPDDTSSALNGAIKQGLDRSLSAQFNLACSASFTDEAAVVYEIQLDKGVVSDTDAALSEALRGDWSLMAALPNQRQIRNIAVNIKEKRTSMTLNLFGFYSATSITDYLKNSTILVDEAGQLSIIDKVDVNRISASTSPYAVNAEKLRKALVTDFLCTATYAVIADKLRLDMAVMQSYFDYNRNMSRDELGENFRLGYALNVVPKDTMKTLMGPTSSFGHASVSATVKYDNAALLNLFYRDPASRKLRTQEEVDLIGRTAMCQLLDSSDATDAARISVLQKDAAWAAMRADGNVANFHYILYLSHLGPTELRAVSADYLSIAWWTDALLKVAPLLSATLAALDAAPAGDPGGDENFMKQRRQLANALGGIARNTNAAFAPGWGEAAIFALSGRRGQVAMDLQWDGQKLHLESPVLRPIQDFTVT
jgi:hypothetical protein